MNKTIEYGELQAFDGIHPAKDILYMNRKKIISKVRDYAVKQLQYNRIQCDDDDKAGLRITNNFEYLNYLNRGIQDHLTPVNEENKKS